MALKVYTNTTDHNIHIDGKTILPGESREVDETQIPGYGVSEELAESDDAKNPLEELLKSDVADMLLALHDLTIEQLDQLENLEGNKEKPRKSVLKGIDARRFSLAERELG